MDNQRFNRGEFLKSLGGILALGSLTSQGISEESKVSEFYQLLSPNLDRLLAWQVNRVTSENDTRTRDFLKKYYGNVPIDLYLILAQFPDDSLRIAPTSKKSTFTIDYIDQKPVLKISLNGKNKIEASSFLGKVLQRQIKPISSLENMDFLNSQLAALDAYEKQKQQEKADRGQTHSTLHLACATGNKKEVLRQLSTSSMDVNSIQGEGSLTPLLVAMLPKDSPFLRQLITEAIFVEKGEMDEGDLEKEIQEKIKAHTEERKPIVSSLLRDKKIKWDIPSPVVGGVFNLCVELNRTEEDKTNAFLKSFLKEGRSSYKDPLFAQDINGNTALHTACLNGQYDLVKELVPEGSLKTRYWYRGKETEKNNNGDTPLMILIKKGNLDLFLYFLESSVDLSETDKDGRTLLHLACLSEGREEDKKEIVKNLLLLTLPSRGPLNLYESQENLSYFLFNRQDKDGYTALHLAVQKRLYSIIGLLLTERDISKEHPSWKGEPFCTNPHIQDNEGRTALHWSCALGDGKSTERILEFSQIEPAVLTDVIPPSKKTFYFSDPKLRVFFQMNPEFYEQFIPASADGTRPPIPPKKGNSALYYAMVSAAKGKEDALVAMMKSPCVTFDICQDDKNVQTVLDEWRATKKFSMEVCQRVCDLLNTKVPFSPFVPKKLEPIEDTYVPPEYFPIEKPMANAALQL